MAVIVLKMTDAGLAAVQAASGTDPVSITELGLTATPFDYAPTLEALPGEYKRLAVASGIAAAANVTHLTAYDTSDDDWVATGLGLFLDDGTLFAVHASETPIMSKVALAFGLLAFDIAFEADLAANIEYGNAVFAYPPATEDTAGVAEIADQAEVDAEEDDQRIVTPRKLGVRLAALLAPVTAAIGTLTAALTGEANTRAAADTALGNALDAEATARANADAALANALDAEATTRANADTAEAASRTALADSLRAAAFKDEDYFTKSSDWSSGSNGNGYWRKTPDGIIEQWGIRQSGVNGWSADYTFPISFTDFASINIIANSSSLRQFAVDGNSISSTVVDVNTFKIGNDDTPAFDCWWRAIGR